MSHTPSFRSQFVTKRTYNRPLNEEGTAFETFEQTVDRVVNHQRWLWETAKGKLIGEDKDLLNEEESAELEELRQLMLNYEAMMSGRTLWLGGTDISKKFHATQFNCSFSQIRTVHDMVDAFHNLLLGCFHPETKIVMADGNLKKISDLVIGDLVLSFNENTADYQEDQIVNISDSQKQEKLHLVFDDGYEVKCTEDHEFRTTNRGWVAAVDLTEEDEIEHHLSSKAPIIKLVKKSKVQSDINYIDITVADNHTFVLENGAVVHNCGVGFEPITGILNGFAKPVEIEVIRSTRGDRGDDLNREIHYRRGDKRVWQLVVGDSGIAWAKAAGKLVAMKKPVDIVVLDFSEVRPGGKTLKGFGWISSGDEQISRAFHEISKILNNRAGELLTRIDILDIMNWLGTSLSSRRSAEIALMPADDPEADEFAVAKKDYWKTGNPQRSQSNNSLLFYHKPTKRELRGIFSQMLDAGGSEPGFINGAAARKRAPWFRGVNPCLPKEALVYVADGRGTVPIGQLADEGNDVPVFCFDNAGEVVVRTMRNPRLTGESQQIYKVTLDDGSVLRATGNHKFLLSDGKTYKEVQELGYGDSLNLISREVKSFSEVYGGLKETISDLSENGYYVITNNQEKTKFEHRAIGEFVFNGRQPGFSIHHKNGNSQDNSPGNLEYMKTEDHIQLHMSGDNNPMRRAKQEWSADKWAEYSQNMSEMTKEHSNGNFSGYTNEQLQGFALELTKKLGRRFTSQEWMEFADKTGAPKSFSDWREAHLGGVYGLACWAANKCGHVNHSMHPHTYRLYDKLLDEGYRCELTEGGDGFVVVKNCEHCGKEFELNPKLREIGYCSRACSAQHNPIRDEKNQEFRQTLVEAHQKLHESKKIEQVRVYNDLKLDLGRTPTKSEWVDRCRTESVIYRLGPKCSFQKFADLSEFASNYNHRVVSVELDGMEDVYNGTVDEFHNFFTGGFETTNNEFGKKKKTIFFNNLNCGEILLGEKSYCNLVTINLNKFNGREDDLHRAFWIMGRANYRQTCVDFRDPILQDTWHELNQFLRLTGVSCAGIVTWEHHQSPKHISKLKKVAREAVDSMALELNLPKSKSVTTGKPDGCFFIDTRIKTSEGELTLGQIFEMNSLIPAEDNLGFHPVKKELYVFDMNNNSQLITKLFNNGISKTLRIDFEDGLSVNCTPIHKFYTTGGEWKQANELTPGDEILSF